MYEMYMSGMYMRAIADKNNVSRERVRQILREYKPDFKILSRKGTGSIEREERECLECHKSFKVLPKNKKKYCSRSCFNRSNALSPFNTSDTRYKEWKKEHNRNKAHDYYWNVLKKKPNFKEIVRERNQRALLKLKNKLTYNTN